MKFSGISNMHKRFFLSTFFMKRVVAIRQKIDLVRWLLEFIRYINASGYHCLTRHDNNEIEVAIAMEGMKRIFFCISDKKIHTFQFPFLIREDNENETFTVFYKDAQINNQMITVFFALLEDIEKFRISLESALDLFVQTVVEFEVPSHEYSYYWQLFIFLLEFEPSYIRYDFDVERHSELHPLYHLDVNYESGGAFKLGLSKGIGCNDFIDILDIKKAPWSVVCKNV